MVSMLTALLSVTYSFVNTSCEQVVFSDCLLVFCNNSNNQYVQD